MSGMDITTIVLAAKSDGITEAAKALDRMTTSADNAEKKVKTLTESVKTLDGKVVSSSQAMSNNIDNLQRKSALLNNLAGGYRGAASAADVVATANSKMVTSLDNIAKFTDLASPAQARLAKEQANAATAAQKLATETERTAKLQDQAALAAIRLSNAQEKLNKSVKEIVSNSSALESQYKASRVADAARTEAAEKQYVASQKARRAAEELAEAQNKVNVSQSRAGTSAEAWTKNMSAQSAAVKSTKEEVLKYNAGQIHYMESLKESLAVQGLSTKQLWEHKAAQLGLSKEASGLIAKLNDGKHAMDGFSLSSANAKRELLVMAREIGRGDMTRFAGSFSIFAQASNLAAFAMTGLGMAVLGAVGTIGVLGVAAIAGAKEMDALNKSISLTGNYAGVTTEKFESLAKKLSDQNHATIGSTKEMLQAMLSSGAFSEDVFDKMSSTIALYTRQTGVSAEDAVKDFSKMQDGVYKWATEHNRSVRFMSEEDAHRIRTLEDTKQIHEAMIATLEAMGMKLQASGDHLNKWGQFWREVGKDMSAVWDIMKGINHETPTADKIADLIGKISQTEAAIKGAGTDLFRGDKLAGYKKELEELRKIQSGKDLENAGKAAAENLKDQQIKAGDYVKDMAKKARGSAEILAEALKAYNDQVNKTAPARRPSEEEQDRVRAYITRMNTPRGTKQENLGGTEISRLKALRDENDRLTESYNIFGLAADKRNAGDLAAAVIEDQLTKKVKDRTNKLSDVTLTEQLDYAQQASASIKAREAKKRELETEADVTLQIEKWSNASKAAQDLQTQNLALLDKSNEARAIAAAQSAVDLELEDKISKLEKVDPATDEKEIQRLREAAEVRKQSIEITMAQAQAEAGYHQLRAENSKLQSSMIKDEVFNLQQAAIEDERIWNDRIEIAKKAGEAGAEILEKLQDQYNKFKKNKLVLLDQAEVNKWTGQLSNIGSILEKNFGRVGKTISGVFTAIGDGAKAQAAIAEEEFSKVAAIAADDKGDKARRTALAHSEAQQKQNANQLKTYGDMAGAAKEFFGANSRGYKILEGVSKAFHAAELARTLISTAASVVGGVAKMFAQSGWGGFAGAAAMLALLGGLGYAATGGGSGTDHPDQSSEAVQKNQGTGSVFGDMNAKSETITKSIEVLSKNSNSMLPLTSQMASSLKKMENGIAGLANLVLRTTGVTDASNMGISLKNTDSIGGMHLKFDPLLNKLFGTSRQSVTDSGLQFGGSVGAIENGQGISQYANVETKKSALFGLIKSTSNNTVTQAVSGEISQQIGLVFKNLQEVLMAASVDLGKNGNEVGRAIESFVITTTKTSLQGLTGDALQKAITDVLSKAMDDIAQTVFPGLDDFRQVGEGYAGTVLRVASGIEEANAALDKFGIKAINYTEIVQKQGDVAAELVRQSITGIEKLDGNLNGVGDIIDTLDGSASELISIYQSLLDVRKLMRAVNLNGNDLGTSLIGGAGGVDKLSSGLSTFQDKFFSDNEKLASQLADLADQFHTLGINDIPATNEAFRELVLATGTSTDATANLTGKLLGMAGAFATTTDVVKKAAEQAEEQAKKLKLSNVDDAFNALQRSVDAERKVIQKAYDERIKFLQSQAEAAKTALDNIRSVFDSLNQALKEARPLSRAAAQGILNAALSSSNAGGSLANFKGLDDALKTVAQPSKALFSTFVQYQRDQLRTANTIESLKNNAGAQVSVAQMTVDAINSSIEQATKNHEESMSHLDNIISVAQAQVNAIKGLDVSILTIAEAIRNFNKASVAAGGGTISSNPIASGGHISTNSEIAAYGDKYNGTGGGGDAYYLIDGVNDYAAKLQNAQNLSKQLADYDPSRFGTLADTFINTTGHTQEYWQEVQRQWDAGLHPTTTSIPSFDVGTDYVPRDMLASIHEGERIVTAVDNKTLMEHISSPKSSSSSNNSELCEEIRQLKEVMEFYGLANVQNTGGTLKIMKKFDNEGIPQFRDETGEGVVVEVRVVT